MGWWYVVPVWFLIKLLGRIPGFYILKLESILLSFFNLDMPVTKRWHSIELTLDPRDPIQRKVAFGNFEVIERRFLKSFLSDKSVAIDIGAHIGLISLALADYMQKHGKILAYEPIPQNLALLKLNCNNHPRIKSGEIVHLIHDSAISMGNGKSSLSLGMESNHLGHEVIEVSAFFSKRTLENNVIVKSIGINDVISSEKSIDFIKMDVEGMEEEIITSISEENIKKVKCIMFEFTMGNHGYTKSQLQTIEYLIHNGFDVIQPLLPVNISSSFFSLSYKQTAFIYGRILTLYARLLKKEPLTTINFVAIRLTKLP